MTADNHQHSEPIHDVPASEFQVPAHDDKGHSARTTIRLQPGMATQLRKQFESGWFDYSTMHQLYRHALKRHAEWLESLAPIVDSVLRRELAIMELLVEEEAQDRFSEVIAKMEKQIGAYMSKGRYRQARSLVGRVYAQVKEMPEGVWKDIYTKEMEEKFELYFREDKAALASFLDLSDDDAN